MTERDLPRARPKRLKDPVILYARIEASQNKALESIAEANRLTKASVIREAIDYYLAGKITGALP